VVHPLPKGPVSPIIIRSTEETTFRFT
jgi:hypothetical protein